MTNITINRIKYENSIIKAFDGRSKVAEVDLSKLTEQQYFITIDAFEGVIITKLKWEAGTEKGTIRQGKGKPLPVKTEAELKSFIEDLADEAQKEIIKAAVKGSNATPAKEPKTKAEKNADGKKKMQISNEQRKRKSARTVVEDALDDYVIEKGNDGRLLVKGRRMLIVSKLHKVAQENGFLAKGVDNGHLKMNVQNVLRGKYNRGEDVFINKVKYNINAEAIADDTVATVKAGE